MAIASSNEITVCKQGEIDIVAWDGAALVFVEVKTKSRTNFGAPQAMVTRQKQAKIVHVAMAYVQEHQVRDTELRFDVVAVTCPPDTAPEVVHVPAAVRRFPAVSLLIGDRRGLALS